MGRLNKFDIHDIDFIAEPSKCFIIINIKCYLLDSWMKKVFLLKIIIFLKKVLFEYDLAFDIITFRQYNGFKKFRYYK